LNVKVIMKRKRLLALLVLTLMLIRLHGVAAWGSDDTGSGIIDRITNAIGDFFGAIINGFKSFFNAIIDAVKWPFTQVGYMFANVYNWSWTHLGPLGVVAFVAIAGMTAYVAIFWFKQNVEQIKNW